MGEADEKVLSLCEEFWQWRLADDPEIASFIGFSEFADRWQDISEKAYLEREERIKEFYTKAVAIDSSHCSPDIALSHRLFVDDLSSYLKGSAFKGYLMPINNIDGIQSEASIFISSVNYDSVEDYKKYICRLKSLPFRIQQVEETLKRGVAQGIVLYPTSLNQVLGQLDTQGNKPVEELNLLKPCLKEPPTIPVADLKQFKEEARSLLLNGVQSAYRSLKKYLEEEYIPQCRASPGVSSLPNGQRWYQQCLDYHLSYATSPQEVHDLGLQEVARIQKQIVDVAKREGLTTDISKLKREIIERQTLFKTKDEALDFVKDICYNRIRPQLPKYFKNIPDIPLKIILVPDYIKGVPLGFYHGGTPDGSREGAYNLNTEDLSKCLPFLLPCLSLHEGEPGHHTQFAHAMTAHHLPNFRRYTEESKYYLAPGKYAKHTAYLEGWGLYVEALGEEMGMYLDNYELLGRYGSEVFRAARMVVDTGLHAFGWSRTQAIQYMLNNTMLEESGAAREIDRYITWPAQSCAYKYGELKIWEMRRRAEKELGMDFDIREFHYRLLSCGAVPLTELEEIVNQFIAETKM
ncbi:uncharacterized protein LOC101858551 [Aplysia californica]|uniref:Uncharacterized protein LOC101858551 n=1 Tax=Aplysia californica TaxID=6500 RepID=A0ABM0JL14_APLCA|nr:uncharacterized protein LOC101858551 [Aplysia californica]